MTITLRLLNRATHLLRSPRLAAALLTLFTLACLLGNFVPQERTAGLTAVAAWQKGHPGSAGVARAIDGHHIYTSTWFIALAGLLALNTLACTVDQYRRARRFRAPAQVPLAGPPATVLVGTPQEVCTRLYSSPLLAGMSRTVRHEDGGTVLLRGSADLGRWGSVILHIALLLVFLVVVFDALTSWSASLVLTEGQSFDPTRQSLHGLTAARLSPPVDTSRLPVIRLAQHYPRYRQQGYNPDSASELTLGPGPGQRTVLVRYGRPLQVAGFTIRQMRGYGAAASITFVPDPAAATSTPAAGPGRNLEAVPVGLTRDNGGGGFTVSLPFTNQTDGSVQTREITVPTLSQAVALHLQPGPLAGDLGRSLGERFFMVLEGPLNGTLAVGTKVRVPGGELRFDSLHYWTVLSVGNAPLTIWFFVAGWLIALGAGLGLIWPTRRVDFDLRPGPEPGLCEIRYRVPATRGAAVFAGRAEEAVQALARGFSSSSSD